MYADIQKILEHIDFTLVLSCGAQCGLFVDPNQVRAAYNHAAYVEQRRRMMQEWAGLLDRWEAGKPVNVAAPSSVLPERLEAIESYLKTLVRVLNPNDQLLTRFHAEAWSR